MNIAEVKKNAEQKMNKSVESLNWPRSYRHSRPYSSRLLRFSYPDQPGRQCHSDRCANHFGSALGKKDGQCYRKSHS